MKWAKTATFLLELPLAVDEAQARRLRARLEAGRCRKANSKVYQQALKPGAELHRTGSSLQTAYNGIQWSQRPHA